MPIDTLVQIIREKPDTIYQIIKIRFDTPGWFTVYLFMIMLISCWVLLKKL